MTITYTRVGEAAHRLAFAGLPPEECGALAEAALTFAIEHGLPLEAVVDALTATWRATRSAELRASLRENKWHARDADAFIAALRERPSLTIDSGALGEALAKGDAPPAVPRMQWQLSGMRAARRNRLRGRARR